MGTRPRYRQTMKSGEVRRVKLKDGRTIVLRKNDV